AHGVGERELAEAGAHGGIHARVADVVVAFDAATERPRIGQAAAIPALRGRVVGVVAVAEAAVGAWLADAERVLAQAFGEQARAAAVVGLRGEFGAVAQRIAHDDADVAAARRNPELFERERAGAEFAAADQRAVRVHLDRAGRLQHAGEIRARHGDEVGVLVERALDADAAEQLPAP